MGYILGFILSGLTGFFTTYGMYRLMDIADSLEESKTPQRRRTISLEMEIDEKDSPDSNSDLVGESIASSNEREFIVKRFQDFPVLVEMEFGRYLEVLIIIVNTVVNLVSNLVNIVMIVTLSKELFGISPLFIKMVSFLLFCLIMILIIEPEKLKHLTSLSILLYMFIGKNNFEIL